MIAHAPAVVGWGLSVATAWSFGTAAGRRIGRSTIQRLWRRTVRAPFTAVDASTIAWSRNQKNQDAVTYYMRPLFTDLQSRNAVLMVRYPAGQINPPHSHPVGHGMYVLRGLLVTHRGTFGPGTFVWFPAGEVMWHGAGPDEALEVLFMAGPNLRTDYAMDASVPGQSPPAE